MEENNEGSANVENQPNFTDKVVLTVITGFVGLVMSGLVEKGYFKAKASFRARNTTTPTAE